MRNFAELGALACVLETDPQTRERMAKAYPQVEFKTGLEPILADPAINAVAIATPVATHADLTTTCLNAGKHVYVEKPLCLDVESGMTLVALAEERERVLMVGHLLHYHPAVIKLKELIHKGRLGKLQYIHSNRLNLGKVRREENILWSFAPHDISVILSLTGEMPDEVGAFGGNYLQSQVADVTVSTMSFPSGVRAHIYVSWLYPYKEQRLVVVGSEGMAVFNDTSPDKKLTLYSHTIHWEHGSVPVPQKMDPEVVEIGQAEPLRAECQHFLDSVAQGKAPLTDGREGLRVLRVLDRCQQSLNLPGTVQLRGESNMGLAQDGDYNVHSTAQVDPGCSIGQGTKIWHFSHVLGGSTIGDECNIGQNVVIGPKARIGSGLQDPEQRQRLPGRDPGGSRVLRAFHGLHQRDQPQGPRQPQARVPEHPGARRGHPGGQLHHRLRPFHRALRHGGRGRGGDQRRAGLRRHGGQPGPPEGLGLRLRRRLGIRPGRQRPVPHLRAGLCAHGRPGEPGLIRGTDPA